MKVAARRLFRCGFVLALMGHVFLADLKPAVGKPGSADRDTVKVAGIVLKWIRTDKDANYRRSEPMIRAAAAAGAKLVCTTECFLDGYAIADKSIPLDDH